MRASSRRGSGRCLPAPGGDRRGGAPRSRPVSLAPRGGASAPRICRREIWLALGGLGQPSAPSGPELHPAPPFEEGLEDGNVSGITGLSGCAPERSVLLQPRSRALAPLQITSLGLFLFRIVPFIRFCEVLSRAGRLKLGGGVVFVKDLSSLMCPVGIMVSNLGRASLRPAGRGRMALPVLRPCSWPLPPSSSGELLHLEIGGFPL